MKQHAVWRLIDEERGALANQLGSLDYQDWETPSLCTGLSVREVLAHLTVSGAISGPRWFAGVVRARFDFDKQVDQRLGEQLGENPQETLERFRATITSRTSPPLPKLALLGEMVVHGEDIRRPLGLVREYSPKVLRALAMYYAASDQVVVARRRIRGLRLEATDTAFSTTAPPFNAGDGSLVTGGTLALIMAMTGRSDYCAELSGPGVSELADRCG